MNLARGAKLLVLLGAGSAFAAVLLGAFGAHALRERLTPEMLAVYQTGVQYHLAHALGLLFVALLAGRMTDTPLVLRSGYLLFTGIILFSGSLYLLAVTSIRALGMVTPLGGVCFLSGWALLVWSVYRDKES